MMQFDVDVKGMLDPSGSYMYVEELNGHHVFFYLNDGINARLNIPFNALEWSLILEKEKHALRIRYSINLTKVSEQVAIERFNTDLKLVCDNLILCPSRFVVEWRWPNLITSFQIFKNGKWSDMIQQTTRKWI